MQFWQHHWLMASPVNFTVAFVLLVQTGLGLLICCPALIVNIILLSYIYFFFARYSPATSKVNKCGQQNIIFFIQPSSIRKADHETYTSGSAGGRELLQAVCRDLCPGSSIYCLYDYLANLHSDYVHPLQYLKIWEEVKEYR